MTSFTIRKTIDSETLQFPELKPLIGKVIEINIRETLNSDIDRFAILEQISQKDLIDIEAYHQYCANELEFTCEKCK